MKVDGVHEKFIYHPKKRGIINMLLLDSSPLIHSSPVVLAT
jgi:hypothetical protein